MSAIESISSKCVPVSGVELYKNSKGEVYQCDRSNRIILIFQNLSVQFRIQDFVKFRRDINKVDIKGKLMDISDECDYELISTPQYNISEKLTLCELIQLRDLVNGAQFALDLNSLLHQILYSEVDLA